MELSMYPWTTPTEIVACLGLAERLPVSTGDAADPVKGRVLLIDDEPSVRRPIRAYLERVGFEVREAPSLALGEAGFRSERPDVVVLDYLLPDGTALDLLPRLANEDSHTPVVVLTGHGTIDLAVRAMQEGADNFLTKPVEMGALAAVLERSLGHARSHRREAAREVARGADRADPFLGTSAAMKAVESEARLAVRAEAPVLIEGETGTGKGVLARWLHGEGPRREGPFVDLNCAGLSRELLESELFGHARGAFTGAVADKKGLIEMAHRGTLFLDEIGDMDVAIQPKLLKVLEDQTFRRLGEVEERRVDVRLIAATNRSLADRVAAKEFREDLYFRINTVTISLPPLRRRREDIGSLAEALFRRLSREMGRPAAVLADEVVDALACHDWPGNVRELRNVLERALLAADGGALQPRHLRFAASSRPPTEEVAAGDDVTLARLEREHIARVLRDERGHVNRSADRLGIPRSTLYERLKTYGIDPAVYR